jgi:hypothetical protein
MLHHLRAYGIQAPRHQISKSQVSVKHNKSVNEPIGEGEIEMIGADIKPIENRSCAVDGRISRIFIGTERQLQTILSTTSMRKHDYKIL